MVSTQVGGTLGMLVIEQIELYVPFVTQLNVWIFFGIMVVAAVLLSQLVGLFFHVVLKALTAKTKTKADDILVHSLQQPLAWLVFSGLLYVAVAPLVVSEGLASLIRSVLVSLNIVLIGWLVHRFVKALFRIWDTSIASKTESPLDDNIIPILSKFSIAIVWIATVVFFLSSWGIQVTPFLAGLGIAGVAIGFAVKDSLGNIFGGISLAFDHAYAKGDKIKLGDGTLGVVYDISLRSTRIKTYDGDLVMVPNGKVANDNIYTYAQPHKDSRVQVDFGVQYGSDPDKVEKLVVETISKIDGIKTDPAPSCIFHNMGDSALEMRAYFWVDDYSNGFGKKLEATKAIYNALNKSKIGIPFPTRMVYTKSVR